MNEWYSYFRSDTVRVGGTGNGQIDLLLRKTESHKQTE